MLFISALFLYKFFFTYDAEYVYYVMCKYITKKNYNP